MYAIKLFQFAGWALTAVDSKFSWKIIAAETLELTEELDFDTLIELELELKLDDLDEEIDTLIELDDLDEETELDSELDDDDKDELATHVLI